MAGPRINREGWLRSVLFGSSKRLRVLLFTGVCLIIVCGSAIYLSMLDHERLRIELVDIACIDDDEDWRVAAKVSSVSDFVETRIFHAALFQNTDEGSTQLDHARGPSSVIDNKSIVELRYPLVEGRTYSVAAFTIESCPITIKRRLSMAWRLRKFKMLWKDQSEQTTVYAIVSFIVVDGKANVIDSEWGRGALPPHPGSGTRYSEPNR